MLDLMTRALPNTITVDGRAYSVYTDFRTWLRFSKDWEKAARGESVNVAYLFKNDHPAKVDMLSFLEFYQPRNPLPRQIGSDDIGKVLDFKIDADLIYAAFMQQYGIDLFETDMHWHKFLALLRGLNRTKLDEVMGYRTYRRSKKSQDEIYEDLRSAWEIPEEVTEEEKAELEEFSKKFY